MHYLICTKLLCIIELNFIIVDSSFSRNFVIITHSGKKRLLEETMTTLREVIFRKFSIFFVNTNIFTF